MNYCTNLLNFFGFVLYFNAKLQRETLTIASYIKLLKYLNFRSDIINLEFLLLFWNSNSTWRHSRVSIDLSLSRWILCEWSTKNTNAITTLYKWILVGLLMYLASDLGFREPTLSAISFMNSWCFINKLKWTLARY